MTVLLCLCFILFGLTIARKHDVYSGYSVYGVKIQDLSHQRILSNVQLDLDLDIWHHGVPELRDAIVMVNPENKLIFLDTLHRNGMKYHLRLADVARNLDQIDEETSHWKINRGSQLSIFETYPTYGEIDEYMEKVARENPSLVTLVNTGPSFEGRPVKYLKISTTNFKDISKPIYFLEATLHAREWVTTQIALYSIHRLVENLRTADRDLLEDTDWIIFPVVNPDGYEFSRTTDRMWRKTRSFNVSNSATCYGADPNRNFDIEFNTISVSSNPCSDLYSVTGVTGLTAAGVGFSYTLEMPGYEYGFQVPPSYINQLSTETWEGIAVSARVARKYYAARN